MFDHKNIERVNVGGARNVGGALQGDDGREGTGLRQPVYHVAKPPG